ncbi:hypothetical protein NQZ79_g5094 [Umbelopsis isabellina]|nr:hypothetical protein NQZ79_g5094 [Umbelopsis isabellina]
MKYGAELQDNVFAPWRLSYIAYDVLKMELKNRQLNHDWNDQDEADFIQLFDNEMNKVYDFISAKMREVEARITYCERTISTFQKNPSMSSEANWQIMDDALTEVLFDVNDLAKFTRVNYIGFHKIVKKHDKWTGRSLQQHFIEAARAKPLDKQRFDVAFVFISSLHDLCRLRGQPRNGDSAAGGDQNAFERATSKYWIHPDNITEVKAIIMLHLPVLIFNKDKKFEASDSAISSVYFDNPDFDLYTGRLQRDEGAEAIRFRWYGPYETPNIFIERKTHHASWLNGASIKDRFPLKEGKVNSYVAGDHTPETIINDMKEKGITDEETINNVNFISTGIQNSIKEKSLSPICRVFYNRTAFQLPGDQRLRLSLDSDMTFIREDDMDGVERRKNHNWRRTDAKINFPFSDLPEKDVYKFPYAVLETKLQTHLGQEPPHWLTTLLDSHLVHEVPRFSKYLHGASYFYQDRLPLLPWWLSEMASDIRKPRSMNTGLSRSKSFKPLIDGQYRRAMEEEEERMKLQNRHAKSNSADCDHSSMTGSTVDVAHNQSEKEIPATQANYPAQSYQNNNYQNVPFQQKMNEKNSYQISTPAPVARRTKDVTETKEVEVDGLGEAVTIDMAGDSTGKDKGKKKVKVKVEPKVFFANERTFISWLQFCALLLTVALNLLNFGDATSRIVGGVFIGLAAVIALYALYRFERRAWMINRHDQGRYDDLWGPAVLCVLLVAALVINFYLRFR